MMESTPHGSTTVRPVVRRAWSEGIDAFPENHEPEYRKRGEATVDQTTIDVGGKAVCVRVAVDCASFEMLAV